MGVTGGTGASLKKLWSVETVELLNFFVVQFPPVLVVTAVCSALHLRREQDLSTGCAVCI